jgi:enhancing lycopene biosynthesis protein 2
MLSPRVGLVLSGCGFKDGSEIHESVIAMLALEEAGATLDIFAPDLAQSAVIDHFTGEQLSSSRNILRESARIARGKIRDLAKAKAEDLDAIVLPGGFGAATNLCNFATSGTDMTVNPQLARLLEKAHELGKPIGAICIAPVILAKVFGRYGCRLTIGKDLETAHSIEKMGAKHVLCNVQDIVVDDQNKLVTTPAYMLGHSVRDIHQGIRKLADEVVRQVKRH